MVLAWVYKRRHEIDAEFEKALYGKFPNMLKQKCAWHSTSLRLNRDCDLGNKPTLVVIATAALAEFLNPLQATGAFADCCMVPLVSVKKVNGDTYVVPLQPALEVVWDEASHIVACRVQFPLVPAAVRTATAMLSATIEEGAQRVVVHSTSSADTTVTEHAHNAPFYIGVTRVRNMADLAITCGTVVHSNMFTPRQPLRNMLREFRAYGENCEVYHCQAVQKEGEVVPSDSLVHDERMEAQFVAGMFGGTREDAEARGAAMPQEPVLLDDL